MRAVGGPSVYPYQPEGVWLPGTLAVPYPTPEQIPAEQQHRRSLYTFVKRNIPPPSMAIFDLKERHATVVRRQTSNTPLQALVMLDDPQYVEAFRVLASNTMKREETVEARIKLMFRMALRRMPTPQELAVLTAQYEREKANFAAAPDNAAKLVHVGVIRWTRRQCCGAGRDHTGSGSDHELPRRLFDSLSVTMNKPSTALARRTFLKAGLGLGSWALTELMNGFAALGRRRRELKSHGILRDLHFPPRAKRVISIHMLGAVSQVDTFDYKPMLEKMHGQQIPDSVKGKARISAMSANQGIFPAGQAARAV